LRSLEIFEGRSKRGEGRVQNYGCFRSIDYW
jgi:hypothetical protein